MGHIRLGTIPKSQKWQAVVSALDSPGVAASDLSRVIGNAAKKELQAVKGHEAVARAIFELIRLTRFSDQVNEFQTSQTISELSSKIASEIRAAVPANQRDAISDIAVQAFQKTLASEIKQSGSLFTESTAKDLERTFQEWRTDKSFGWLTRVYFANFYGGLLRFVANKELSNHVGSGGSFSNSGRADLFDESLDTYALQACRIVQDFGSKWASKHSWQKTLDRATTKRFVSYALQKLRMDMERE